MYFFCALTKNIQKTLLDFAALEEVNTLCEPQLLRTFSKETTDLILLEYNLQRAPRSDSESN